MGRGANGAATPGHSPLTGLLCLWDGFPSPPPLPLPGVLEMGFFDDMLSDGMRETQRVMRERGVSYEKARRIVLGECEDCSGSGWIGHGMGGDTCAKCGGKGIVK